VEIFVERCAALDVHKKQVTACVRTPGEGRRRAEAVRTFGTTTGELLGLRDWLDGFGVTVVGMEATGVYWKPVYYILEDTVECWLLNARHVRNVPGRKTDVCDAQWLCQLVEHGLVKPSFVPPPPIRELRDLTRYRRSLIQEQARERQRVDKVLQDAGIKLSSEATDVLGVSAREMLDQLVAGERDVEKLADLARGRMRSKIPALQEALRGHFGVHHALILGEMLAHIDTLDAAIERISVEIGRRLAPFDDVLDRLDTIPGVGRRTAEDLVAEIGLDMDRFPTPGHLASWAALAPGNNESAGKHRSGKTRRGNKWLRACLVEAGHGASHTKGTHLRARYDNIRRRRGAKRAIVAVAHSILIAAYHVIATGEPYRDLGPDWINDRRRNPHHERRLIQQLERKGYKITPPQAA
jgi:transposase